MRRYQSYENQLSKLVFITFRHSALYSLRSDNHVLYLHFKIVHLEIDSKELEKKNNSDHNGMD